MYVTRQKNMYDYLPLFRHLQKEKNWALLQQSDDEKQVVLSTV
jgi:hypothetical protein